VEPPATSDAFAIRITRLTKDYGQGHGLFDLDLDVQRGEILGFLGPNGAGKSTTMRLLLDLIKPTSGSATLLGLDSRADSLEIRRRVGFLPGELALYPILSGAAMLDYLAELRGGVDRGVRDALAERFDADLGRRIRELSTGNRQKLGLIQAFMHEPELLILDEPIAGLDPLVQQSFHALLREVATQGRTVFLSSHTLSEVERVADRVAILRRGRLVVVDSFEDLREVAVQRLEIEFGGDAPRVEELAALPGVREVALEGAHLVVAFEGSADALVKAIAAHEVRSIRSRDDDLEEIFLRYYRDRDGA
jgi:ABC-2 type transport system ATP-binding protein